MYPDDFMKKVQDARRRGYSWNELHTIFSLPKTTCQNFVFRENQPKKKQHGNHVKVKAAVKKQLKAAVKLLVKTGQRITAPKLLNKTHVCVSSRTVQRFLHSEGLKYITPQNCITLSDNHKAKRYEICQSWRLGYAVSFCSSAFA